MGIALGGFLAVTALVFVIGLASAKKSAEEARERRREFRLHRDKVRNAHAATDWNRERAAAIEGAGNNSTSQHGIALAGVGQGRDH